MTAPSEKIVTFARGTATPVKTGRMTRVMSSPLMPESLDQERIGVVGAVAIALVRRLITYDVLGMVTGDGGSTTGMGMLMPIRLQ